MTEGSAALGDIGRRSSGGRRVADMDKVVATPTEAIAGITDGMTLAVGGFGLCGIPSVLIAELHRQGVERAGRVACARQPDFLRR